MTTKHRQGFCPLCERAVLAVRDGYSHGVFLILLLLLFVLTYLTQMQREFLWILGVTWIVIWLLAVQYNGLQPWLCTQCGAEVALQKPEDSPLQAPCDGGDQRESGDAAAGQ